MARRKQLLRCEGGGASELGIQRSTVCHCDRHGDKNGERITDSERTNCNAIYVRERYHLRRRRERTRRWLDKYAT